MSKCSFSKEVDYLAHAISREGVKVDPNNINEIFSQFSATSLNVKNFLCLMPNPDLVKARNCTIFQTNKNTAETQI